MFLAFYLSLLLLAALPLARTIPTGRGGQPGVMFLHRLYRDLAYIGAAALVIICFETALTISLQVYWFSELGQTYRYWLALGLRVAIFFALLISSERPPPGPMTRSWVRTFLSICWSCPGTTRWWQSSLPFSS